MFEDTKMSVSKGRSSLLFLLGAIILLLTISYASAATGARRYHGGGGKYGGKAGKHQRYQQAQHRQYQPEEDGQKGDYKVESSTAGAAPDSATPAAAESEERFCMLSAGFLAPLHFGPLGLRVKRDADLPVDRGLFLVIAIEPNSPGASTLHVGDTITVLSGKQTKDMTVASFSQTITEARSTGTGLITMTFWSKHCPPPPQPVAGTQPQASSDDINVESSQKSERGDIDQPVKTESSPSSEDAAKRDQNTKHQQHDSQGKQEEKEEGDEEEETDDEIEEEGEEEGEEEDQEGDEYEAEDEDDETTMSSGAIYGEYLISLDNFQPPLGLRVSQDGAHLVVLGVMAKPELWTKVKVGDVLKSIEGDEPRNTNQLKEVVLRQQGKKSVTVRFLRKLPRMNTSKKGPELGEAEFGPKIHFTVNHVQSKPLGMRLAPLPQTGNSLDGFLAVVEIREPLNEWVQIGDRLRLVGGSMVSTSLEVSEALGKAKNSGETADGTIPLTFVRGVPGTLNDLGREGGKPAEPQQQRQDDEQEMEEDTDEDEPEKPVSTVDRPDREVAEQEKEPVSPTRTSPPTPSTDDDEEESNNTHDDSEKDAGSKRQEPTEPIPSKQSDQHSDDQSSSSSLSQKADSHDPKTTRDNTQKAQEQPKVEEKDEDDYEDDEYEDQVAHEDHRRDQKKQPNVEKKSSSTKGTATKQERDDDDEKEKEASAAVEKMRAEAQARIREAEELRQRADAALKELERRKAEQEKERQHRQQKQEEERKRKERELQEKREKLERELRELEEAQRKESCVDPAQADAELEDRIFQALLNPSTARAIAKEIAKSILAESDDSLVLKKSTKSSTSK